MIVPMFLMVVLITFVFILNLFVRLSQLRKGNVSGSYFKVYQGDAPEIILRFNRHISNLFEAPMLFFAGCLAVLALGVTDEIFLKLGYVYVILRATHTYIHLFKNKVGIRAPIFVLSNFCIMVIWVRLMLASMAFAH